MGVSTGLVGGYGGVWFIWRSKYLKMCCSAAGRQVAAGAVSDVHVSRYKAEFDSGGVFYAPWFVLVNPRGGLQYAAGGLVAFRCSESCIWAWPVSWPNCLYLQH